MWSYRTRPAAAPAVPVVQHAGPMTPFRRSMSPSPATTIRLTGSVTTKLAVVIRSMVIHVIRALLVVSITIADRSIPHSMCPHRLFQHAPDSEADRPRAAVDTGEGVSPLRRPISFAEPLTPSN